MEKGDISLCPGNCTQRGTCDKGICTCLIHFCGNSCNDVNVTYFLTFGAVFVCLGAVAFVQLCLCIWGEHSRGKYRSLTNAYKITVQKLLYVLTICATVVRGTYYIIKWRVSDGATSELWLVYYPLLLTGFSLIVCIWAEEFHGNNALRDRQDVMRKSRAGCTIFNFYIYCMLLMRILVSNFVKDSNIVDLVGRLYNGMFVLMILTILVFFLIYGVEVYFKFHGAESLRYDGLDTAQVHMSRTGLIAQACLQLFIVLFLILDVLKQLWIDKVSVPGLNLYDIGFRLVEFGVALWFPCVLWNCFRPEELWVLNPRRIFKQLSTDCRASESDHLIIEKQTSCRYGATEDHETDVCDCWICYDNDRQDAGALIKPCKCRGDVSTVHHGCLKKWLAECVEAGQDFKCKICGKHYKLESGWVWMPKGVSSTECLKTLACLFVILSCPTAATLIIHHLDEDTLKLLVISVTICVEALAIRVFASSVLVVYKKMKLACTKISGTVIYPCEPSNCQMNADLSSSKRRTMPQTALETHRDVSSEIRNSDNTSISPFSDFSKNDACTESTVQQRLENVSDNCNARSLAPENINSRMYCDDQNHSEKESLQTHDSSNHGRSFNVDMEYQSSFTNQGTFSYDSIEDVSQDTVTCFQRHDCAVDKSSEASNSESPCIVSEVNMLAGNKS